MSNSFREAMRQVAAKREKFVAGVLEGEAGIKIEWSPAEAALGLAGFRKGFWEILQGRTLRADVGEDSVTIKITDQALEAQALGRQLWQDLVDGFTGGQKDQTTWKRTYNFLSLVLSAGYNKRNLKPMLENARRMRIIDPQAFEMFSLNSIYTHIMEGGDINGLDLELSDLHLAAAGIYYGILGPGTRNEVLAPETIGQAATS